MAEAVEAATMEAVVGEVGEAREVREAARAGPSSRDLEAEVDQRALAEQRRRERHPPILFTDIDGAEEFEALAKELEGVELSEEERQGLEELRQYLVQGEGSWVLGDPALALLGRVLGDDEAAAAGEARVRALRALAAAARRDDVALLLHQDRRAHCLMAFAARVEEARVSGAERLALAQFLANLSAHAAAAEWPLYVSEWAGGRCNLRVTTKVCVHAVLAADAALRDAGTALLYNVATREVKSVVGIRLRLCLLE